MGIERTEYDSRQAAARKLARERGFSALVAWSRGGSTQDHYADVYFLTGFYTHQPFIPDEPGRWRAHGHTALVLPDDGPTTLLVDMTELQDPKPAVDRVSVTEDLVESLATTVAETVPPGTDVALLGGEVLAWRWGLVSERSMQPWRLPSRVLPKRRSRRRPSHKPFARAGHSTGWGSPRARGLTRSAPPPPLPTAVAA